MVPSRATLRCANHVRGQNRGLGLATRGLFQGQLKVPTLRSSCRMRCHRSCVVTVAVRTSHFTTQGTPLKNARERMNVIAAYRDVAVMGAAAIAGPPTRP